MVASTNFAEYTQLALRTKAPTYTRDHIMMGLFGEAGEVVDLIKKVVAHGHPVTPELLAKARAEIGDVLWHVAIGAVVDGVDPSSEGGDFFFGTVSSPDLAMCSAQLRLNVIHVEQHGDVVAYKNAHITLCMLARAFSTTLKQCAIENIEKLRKRYPDGFSSEASQARVDVVADGAPVIAKEFVLERTRRGEQNGEPWYLYPTISGTGVAWTNKKELAIRFKTADDALKLLERDLGFVRDAYVFRAEAVK